ncbi:hypothetical protein HY792_03325 [Candidatus Desantisbacteria bacterium]|nr:hypothetical protein [Candidatus Desantisbacteria bacterium]
MGIQNKTEAGMSFVELMIAGLLLLIVALAASTTFMSSSHTIIKSWDESVAVARAQQLLEEVKGLKYEYIHQAATASTHAAHLHLSVINPVIIGTGATSVETQVRVIAHTEDNYVATGDSFGTWTITWKPEDGTNTSVENSLNGSGGIFAGTIALTTENPRTKRLFGMLSVGSNGSAYGTSTRLMIFPAQGESIAEKDMMGTMTMSAKFIDDAADNLPTDIFPDDYKQVAVTVTCGKSGGKSSLRSLTTIIAPKPASYY